MEEAERNSRKDVKRNSMEEVKCNSLQAWILAARPKTLTGAITPVLIGTALATMDGHFHWLPALVCCLFAGLMQIAANFINDLFDFLKGTDREDRLGPERACAQGWISPQAMKIGIIATVALACLIGCTLLFFAGWELIIVGILCVLFAFLYTTGPYPSPTMAGEMCWLSSFSDSYPWAELIMCKH